MGCIKHLIFIIITFVTVNCFAIEQKLIVAANEYIEATQKLENLKHTINAKKITLEAWQKDLAEEQNKGGFFRSVDRIESYQTHVNETKNRINELNLQYAQLEESVKKLEPIKKEYDEQLEKERKKGEFWSSILNYAVLTLFVLCMALFIAAIIWGFIYSHRKYARMLKEGKITQEEYKKIMSNCSSCSNCNCSDINPSTGLPMTGIGISDVSGTPRGASSTTNSSMRSF